MLAYRVTHFSGVCRDFVNLRRWEKRGDVFVSCNVAVECDEMPPKKEHVRYALILSDEMFKKE